MSSVKWGLLAPAAPAPVRPTEGWVPAAVIAAPKAESMSDADSEVNGFPGDLSQLAELVDMGETDDLAIGVGIAPGQIVGPPSAEGAPPRRKAVSFHSNTGLPPNKKITTAEECVKHMMLGASFIKVRPRRHYHRVLALSADLLYVRWTPGRPRACAPLGLWLPKVTRRLLCMERTIAVEDIREIRVGLSTKVHRDSRMPPGYPDDWAFSILYGDDLRTLDLIAHCAEDARIWVAGLCALIGEPHPIVGGGLRERWLRNAFEREAGPSGRLGAEAAAKLAASLTACGQSGHTLASPDTTASRATPAMEAAKEKLAQKLAEMGRKTSIESSEFIDTYKQVVTRSEVYFLMLRFSHKEYLTAEDLQAFLECEQGRRHVSLDLCEELIRRFEPSPEARDQGVMLVDGFSRFLESDECLLAPAPEKTRTELSFPLSHYFISAAHDAYVLDDPASNTASMDAIARALAQPCRYIKLDVYDGVAGPVVSRNPMSESRLPASDVLRLVREMAFVCSQCPLLLHLSCRCSVPQQRSLAALIRSELGDMLVTPHEAKDPAQIEVRSLLGRILLVGKRFPNACHEEVGPVSEEDSDGPQGGITSSYGLLVRELSELVALESRACHAVDAGQGHAPGRLCSLSDALACKMSRLRPEDVIAHCRNSLTRVYPNPERTAAANFNPQDAWNAGCQIVAVNLQTPGQHMDVYEGRFRSNGGTGFAIKPSIMCDGLPFLPADTRSGLPGVAPKILRVAIISGQHLPRPRGCDARGTAIDPYVAVQVFGIQADNNEKKTRTVSNEGDSPVFEETFEMVVLLPELALLRFVVLDDEYIGDPFIGQFTVPLQCVETGFRVVRLLNAAGEPLDGACLFVHIEMWSRRGRPSKKKRYRKEKLDLRTVGIASIDDLIKISERALRSAMDLRCETDNAMNMLRSEWGLTDGANMQACLRVFYKRLSRHRGLRKAYIQEVDQSPTLRIEADSMSEALNRSLAVLERACERMSTVTRTYASITTPLKELVSILEESARDFPSTAAALGLKGTKFTKSYDNLAWNIRVIRGLLLQLAQVHEMSTNGLIAFRGSSKALSQLGSACGEKHSVSRTCSNNTNNSIPVTLQQGAPHMSNSDPESMSRECGRLSPQSNSSTSKSPAASPGAGAGGTSGGISPSAVNLYEAKGVSPRPPRGILKAQQSPQSCDQFA